MSKKFSLDYHDEEFIESEDTFSEMGYFVPSQFEDMMDWIFHRKSYSLEIYSVGIYITEDKEKKRTKFEFTGEILKGFGQKIDRSYLMIKIKNAVLDGKVTNRPYLLCLNSISKGRVISNWGRITEFIDVPIIGTIMKKRQKGNLFFKHFRLKNDFVQDKGTQSGFVEIYFNFANSLRWIDKFLHTNHIKILAVGDFYGFSGRNTKPIPVLMEGEVLRERGFFEREIIVKVDRMIADNLRKGRELTPEKPLLMNTEIVLPLFGFRTKSRDIYFKPLIINLILDEPREKDELIIDIEDLSINFDSKYVVDKATFGIEQGKILGIVGESGAGKSVTIKAMLGILKYTGNIYIMGIDAQRTKRLAPFIGYVPQDLSLLYHDFTPLENCIHFGRQYGLDEEYISRRAKEIFMDLNISTIMATKVSEISGGEKRRASIAISLIHDPQILILDEPTSGLDPMTRFELWNFLDKINKKYGTTMVVISHYLDEIDYCDKAAIYFNGIGFYDFDTPNNLKKKLPGDGIALEITLEKIDLNAAKLIGEIKGVKEIIQRGEKLHILSDLDNNLLKEMVIKELDSNNIKIYEVEDEKQVDMMDYFTVFSQLVDHSNSNGKSKSGIQSKTQNKVINTNLKQKLSGKISDIKQIISENISSIKQKLGGKSDE